MKSIITTLILLFTVHAFGGNPLPHEPSPEILRAISEHNAKQSKFSSVLADVDTTTKPNVRPFAEYEKTGYVFFNDDDYYGYAYDIKNVIANNLPADVTLVVYTTSGSTGYVEEVRQRFSQYIESSRLMVISIPESGNDFWTRDNFPVPVWQDDQFGLVNARYYYNFEPDDFITNLYAALQTSHNYFYEGGNFMANSRGECLVVNRKKSYPGGVSDTAAIPDAIFRDQYGCKKLTRFKHLKGIGHADEVIKFMSDDVVVTDTEEYIETLEGLGYEVHLLPEPNQKYETYVNSLQVNDVLFVPSFDEDGDKKAVDVYQAINPNLKIITIPTADLATGGQGGIHCITMGYPPVPMQPLFHSMGAKLH